MAYQTIDECRSLWAALALDVALMAIPNVAGSITSPEMLCKTYDISNELMLELFQNKEFTQMVLSTKKQIEAMGDKGPMQMRAQVLGMDVMEDLYRKIKSETVEFKDIQRYWEKLMQYGLLDPATNGTSKQSAGNMPSMSTQINLVIPQGIPGIEHITQAAIEAKDE